MTKINRIYLEITDACNLDCSFCTNSKGQSYMKLEDIKICLKQIKDVCDYVYLHVLGEPLLHPNIKEIFDECYNLGLKIQLVTNGTLLKKHIELLNHQALRKLSISLHSMNNMQNKNEYFDLINSIIESNTNSYIELRFYNYEKLDKDLQEYKDFLYQKYNVEVTPKKESYKIKDNVYIYYQDIFNWPNILDPLISEKGTCKGAINQLAILHNLDVTICCLDPKGYNRIGSLKEDSLINILNSPLYINTVNNFKNNILSFNLCKRCLYRTRFDDKHNLKQ